MSKTVKYLFGIGGSFILLAIAAFGVGAAPATTVQPVQAAPISSIQIAVPAPVLAVPVASALVPYTLNDHGHDYDGNSCKPIYDWKKQEVEVCGWEWVWSHGHLNKVWKCHTENKWVKVVVAYDCDCNVGFVPGEGDDAGKCVPAPVVLKCTNPAATNFGAAAVCILPPPKIHYWSPKDFWDQFNRKGEEALKYVKNKDGTNKRGWVWMWYPGYHWANNPKAKP